MRESQAAYGVARRRQSISACRRPRFAVLAVWVLAPLLQLVPTAVAFADQITVNDAALDELRPSNREAVRSEAEHNLLTPPPSALESRFYRPGQRDVPEEARVSTKASKPTPKFLGLAGPRLGDAQSQEIAKRPATSDQAARHDAANTGKKESARFFGLEGQKVLAEQGQKKSEQQSNVADIKHGTAVADAPDEDSRDLGAPASTRAPDFLSGDPVKAPEAPKELLETRIPEYLLRDDIAQQVPSVRKAPEGELAKLSNESLDEGPDEAAQESELAAPSGATSVPPPAPDTVETPSADISSATPGNQASEAAEPVTEKTQTAALPTAQSSFETVSLSFQSSGSELGDEAKNRLKDVAARLTENPRLRIQVIAYGGDASASAADARRLALTRATVVRAYLESLGVSQRRVDLRPLGVAPVGEPHRVEIRAAAS